MKTLSAIVLLFLSVNAFSAVIQDCQVEGAKVKGIVVLNEAGTNSIQKILDSKKSTAEKKAIIKKILYVETVSIGDGNSVCELAAKQYKVSEEKCLNVMKSSDVLSTILEEVDESEATLDCRIGITAKLLMEFNM